MAEESSNKNGLRSERVENHFPRSERAIPREGMISMEDLVLDSIKTLSYVQTAETNVQPAEPIFTLTASQLRDIVTEATEHILQDLQGLMDEVAQLKVTITAQGEKIAALTTTQETDMNRITLDIAQDRQRISKLEHKEPEPTTTKKVKGHIEELHKLMIQDKNHWFSIDEIALALNISKETLRKLKAAILEDGRFEMGFAKSPGMRGKKGVVIKIKQFIK
jgi:hypothetical protein